MALRHPTVRVHIYSGLQKVIHVAKEGHEQNRPLLTEIYAQFKQEIKSKKWEKKNRNHTKFVLRLNRFKLEITNKVVKCLSVNNP